MMDPRVDEWNLVVKVQYGDTLRRFGAYVHGHAMNHDMVKLKAKIINLFGFSPDTELILTYIDEDGDIVTLDDDGELHDAAISQRLNPLRINVTLKSTDTGKSEAKVEPTSTTSTRSPHVGLQPLHQVASSFKEAVKSIPEPLQTTLLEISNDYVSKAASSSPAFGEFLEYFSKLGLSNIGQPSRGPNGESLVATTNASTHTMDLNVSEEAKVSNDHIPPPSELPSRNSINPIPEGGNMFQGIGATIPAPVDLNMDNSHPSGYFSVRSLPIPIQATNNVELEKGLEACREGKTVLGDTAAARRDGQSTDHNSYRSKSRNPYPPPCGITDVPRGDCMHSYKRAHRYDDNMLRTFHRGVQCDGCGMHPIMGPRFKSNVKEDYDLCSICFAEMGNEAEYTRIDRSPYRPPRYFNPHFRHGFSSAHGFRGCGMRSSKWKLESRFIQDVTVFDGTLLPPSTPFTKIWRMRNNGSIAWPYGTQLVWIGGDQLGNRGSVELEIPANGCLVDQEIDIAVDFTSPSRPGRYISYWRMASPTGQKFGQRVWVLIQVDISRPNSSGYFHAGINLNFPPESIGRSGHDVIDVNVEPMDGVYPATKTAEGLVKPSVNEVPAQKLEPASVDVLLGANDGITQPAPGGVVNPISYPIIGFPESSSNAPTVPVGTTPTGVVTPISYPIIDFPESSSSAPKVPVGTTPISFPDDDPMEHSLLRELEEMGFKQIDLNKEILRQNEYDLAQSVDDLCGFAEWDPLLQELQEMGFNDEEMNRRLLIKNGGSIKRAVMDLIAGDKADVV